MSDSIIWSLGENKNGKKATDATTEPYPSKGNRQNIIHPRTLQWRITNNYRRQWVCFPFPLPSQPTCPQSKHEELQTDTLQAPNDSTQTACSASVKSSLTPPRSSKPFPALHCSWGQCQHLHFPRHLYHRSLLHHRLQQHAHLLPSPQTIPTANPPFRQPP